VYVSPAEAITQAQRNVIDSGALYFNVEPNVCGPAASVNTNQGKNIYVLGDSLTVGMRGQGMLQEDLTQAGWIVNKINGVAGENISWGAEQIQADSAIIADSDSILVGLGTNDIGDAVSNSSQTTPKPGGKEVIKSNMQNLIDNIRSVNSSATIYWTSVYITGTLSTQFGTFDMDVAREVINDAINESAQENQLIVVPWGISAEARNLISSDGIHPFGNYPEMTDYVVGQLQSLSGSNPAASQQTGSATGTASGPVTLSTPGGTTYTLDTGWQEIIAAAAARFEIDPYILVGILRVETGWPNSAEVEARRIRNSATATGPFQILDLALQDISDRPDEDYARAAQPNGRVVRSAGGTNTAFEVDGSLILDGNKDGVVSRHNPWDAAFMSAAYVKTIGGEVGLPLGNETDPLGTANDEIAAGTNTVAKVFAHYNQGPNWTSNNPVQGNNNVEHYIVNGLAGYQAVQAAGWFGAGVFSPGTGCNSAVVAGEYVWPVTSGGRITSCWSDLRNKTISGGSYYHSGVDIAAAPGEEVVSVTSGNVVFAGQHSSYGGLVIIEHSNGIFSHYGHLSSVDTSEGTAVISGQAIGKVGNTGVSLGDHLHLNFYDSWPFGELPEGAATSDGTKTINPFTNGLVIPPDVPDEASCKDYPNGGREVDIEL
jgi:murein DD-endopeptidase MepM/ murein hydrolase activator NlpD/lysophospholipase L1-like esterase